ncbi:methyltransferase domain-containing protein [Acinetobacter sp. ANC 4910]|uniref:O-methyltransferase n=1 Tax=Acinetobacter sp. ANC 4910 TaxID=2529850 RepID=UPI00103CD124|nr:class I SAM-dependent methyltransferase [Acinetobacter sp. ANC 4910]TCB36267.1 methyltransferase domain-containing protein [Acinetobacter sp. ANC 4910]
MSMSQQFKARINDLYVSFKKHDVTQKDRLRRYRNIEPDSAQFLAMQIRIQKSKKVLEIGTSTGYSTLWLADALQVTQGQLTTLEIDAARSQQAQQFAQEFGLDSLIQFWVGDAKNYLAECTEKYDLILLDAERDAYVDYWSDLKRLLSKQGGVLIVDNVISHAEEVKTFTQLVKEEGNYLVSTLSLGAGLLLITAKDYDF